MTQRWLYAGLMWVAYLALFLIAFNHNEGIAGLTFRLTLGVRLLYTSAEAGLLATIRQDVAADADITRHWSVRKYRRNAAIKQAKLEIDSEYELSRLRVSLDRVIARKALKVDSQSRLLDVKSNGQTPAQPVSNPERFPYPIDKAQKDRTKKQRLERIDALDKVREILFSNPDATLREVAEQIGRSHETVRQYIGTLERQGVVYRNGSGLQVVK